MMRTVRCFAGLRDAVGSPGLEVDLAPGATAADLKRAVEARVPALAGRLAGVRVAAGYEFLSDDEPLPAEGELALIPPVSGGAPEEPDRVRIDGAALDAREALDFVRRPAAGAVASFVGTVRESNRGRAVRHLDYEAYEGMAEERLRRVAREARERFGALRVAILHRTGRVEVGGDAVVIAVCAPHRDEAFAACRHVIESLKADVPIWKKEIYEDGEAWSGWGS